MPCLVRDREKDKWQRDIIEDFNEVEYPYQGWKTSWKYAKKIACPVLAIRGEHSNFFSADSARRLNSLIADYELHTISDAGHLIPMEKPERCARLIQDFVHRRILAVN